VVGSLGRIEIVEPARGLLKLADFAVFLVDTELVGVLASMTIEGHMLLGDHVYHRKDVLQYRRDGTR
jgi:hypothetical protein